MEDITIIEESSCNRRFLLQEALFRLLELLKGLGDIGFGSILRGWRSFLDDLTMGEENLIVLIEAVSCLDFVVGSSIQTFGITERGWSQKQKDDKNSTTQNEGQKDKI